MRIKDLLKKQGITLGAAPKSKQDAIDILVKLHERCGNLSDTAAYKKGILAREDMGTTAIGMEVAIPHAKSEAVKAPALTAITVPNGVDYDSPDGAPVKLIFMIAATLDGDVHLEVLARLMQMLMHEDFTAKLKAAKSATEFLKIIDDQETKQFPEEAAAPAAAAGGYRVLAVTACPTGIAHTYMAAEALAKAGDKMGITVKVETNGSGGAKNVLTAEEIANCDGIIIAADKNVETARFDGKPVLMTKVADGIHKPEELINKIVNKEVGVLHSDHKPAAGEASGGDESFGRKLQAPDERRIPHASVRRSRRYLHRHRLPDRLLCTSSAGRQLRYRYSRIRMVQEHRRRSVQLHAARTRRLYRYVDCRPSRLARRYRRRRIGSSRQHLCQPRCC